MARNFLLCLALLLSVAALRPGTALAQPRPAAQAQPIAPQAPAPAPVIVQPSSPVDSSYQLGGGDVIQIDLVGRNDFGSHARISNDGTILLPMIGVVKASGAYGFRLGRSNPTGSDQRSVLF